MGRSPSDDSLNARIDDNNDGVADASTALDMTGNWHLSLMAMVEPPHGRRLRHGAGQRHQLHTPEIWMREDGIQVQQDRAQHECEGCRS